MAQVDKDWEAEADMDAIRRAAEVQSDSGRMIRLQSYLADKRNSLDEALESLSSGASRFNNSTVTKRSL